MQTHIPMYALGCEEPFRSQVLNKNKTSTGSKDFHSFTTIKVNSHIRTKHFFKIAWEKRKNKLMKK